MTTHNLLVELLVEELPPKALSKLGDAFAGELFAQLRQRDLTTPESVLTSFATPRRLAAHITAVAARAADRAVQHKLMPVSVGLNAQGQPTTALCKKLAALGADVSDPAALVATLQRQPDGKAEALFYASTVAGVTLAAGLQEALTEALARLPIPKVMSYQLETGCDLPGWSSVQFVRPAHKLIALYADQTVDVTLLGLKAGRQTLGHRFEAHSTPLTIAHADTYATTLLHEGRVLASIAQRRAEIARQLAAAAAQVGGCCRPIDDAALLDEVTALVEYPNVLVCQFEPEFLQVPQECLILTMKANQKYFPLLDAQNKLTNRFLVVSNISPADTSAVVAGNERVVRPRLSDAKFFFDQDRKKTLESRVAALDKVVYHNKLGSQGARMQRVCAISVGIAGALGDAALVEPVRLAARLAKADLLTDMVGEFPELQGTMGRYYALHDGLSTEVADAIEDHYKPRFAGDALPRNRVGLVVALADKLETLVGMFGIGNLPSGDKDPFALRRHALGVIRMLVERELPLALDTLLQLAAPAFGDLIADAQAALADFIFERLAGSLREQGYRAQEVDAVLALRPQRLADVALRLAAVRAFAALPEAAALASANKRVGNILRKADLAAGTPDAAVDAALLSEPAEQALWRAITSIAPHADAAYLAGQYTEHLQALAALKEPVDAFFEQVMVNAEDPAVRANRLALLARLHAAMNRVADLSRLAV